jgi:WD40 repeat protein
MMSAPTRQARTLVLLTVAAVASLLAPAPAQCPPAWLPTIGAPGTDQRVNAIANWDPDGAGPATPVLVVGGEFVVAGDIAANRVATYDPATGAWSALGSGVDGAVYAIAVMSNGDLVVGGQFTTAGGTPASNIARWNGSAWTALGAGTDQRVQALAVMPSGDVVAGGLFTMADGAPANHVARWDGLAWSSLGSGTNNQVHALAVTPNGDLVVGGLFTVAGGGSASRIARWDGTNWFPVGTGLGAVVRSFAFFPNGDLLAGTEDIGSPFRWNGSTWTELGAPGAAANGTVLAVAVHPNGDVIAGGTFWGMGGVPMPGLAKWNGTTWSPFGTGLTNSFVNAIALLGNGDVVVGGQIAVAGGNVARNLARWDGLGWSALGAGVVFARTMAIMPTGDVVVGSRVAMPGAPDIRTPARWNGSVWSSFGGGFGATTGDTVTALLALPRGELIAAGSSLVGSTSLTHRIARWDGSNWTTLGVPDRGVKAMVAMPNGDIVVGGTFNSIGGVPAVGIARWNGTAWAALGSGIVSSVSAPQAGDVRALAVMPNGDLIAGGDFAVAGGVMARNIALWGGTAWSQVGTGFNNDVNALTVLPNGNLVAGGAFSTAGTISVSRVAQWDGVSWSPLGLGLSVPLNGFQDRVWALAALPDGTLVAGGEFATAGGAPATGIARWDGSNWSAIGSGLNGSPEAFGVLPDGRLAMAGAFSLAGGAAACNIALVTSTCPALAITSGTGCAGAGGPMVLAATTLPWLAGTFRNHCSGMAANSLAASLIGLFPQNSPLSALHPAAGAACMLLASADSATLLLPVAGAVSHQFALPLDPALAGVTLYNQVLQIELGTGGGITWLGGSNALVLTTGTY